MIDAIKDIISFIFVFALIVMGVFLIGLLVEKREKDRIECRPKCEPYIVKYKDPSGRCICSKELFVGDGGLTDEEKATE